MNDILFLTIIITVCFCECTTTPVQKVYVDASDNVALQCSVENITLASWLGPCESHLPYCGSSRIRYFIGFAKSPHINKLISLRTNGGHLGKTLSYDLHILNITSKYIGNYTCTKIEEGFSTTTTTYQILFKDEPRVSVGERNMSVIEGTHFTVRCVSDSNPKTSLMQIKKGGVVLKTCSTTSCNCTLMSSRRDSGRYVCTAKNEVGETSEMYDVNVLFPPNIEILMTNERTLQCKVEGNPRRSTYLSWKHFSDHGTLIRTFPGSEFLNSFYSLERYFMNGVYVCEATNGIPNMTGKTSTSGTFSVSLTGPPEILPVTKRIQYGILRKLSTIRIYLYSVSDLIETTLHTNRTISDGIEMIRDNISVKIFGIDAVITGYKISYVIENPTESDFTDYTFEFKNSNGFTNYTVHFKDIVDDTKEKKNGTIITYFIGISIGSSIVGALLSLCIYRCCQKVRIRSNSNIAPTIEVQYDEINEGHFYEMEEVPVILRQQVTNRPTNPTTEAETENENRNTFSRNNNVAIEVQYNEIGYDIRHEMSDRLVHLRHQDINSPANFEIVAETQNANLNATYANDIVEEDEAGLDSYLSDDNSNSDSSSDKPRNSYINVPQSAGNQYQSLVGGKSGDIEDSSYDQLNAGNRLEALYHNLRI